MWPRSHGQGVAKPHRIQQAGSLLPRACFQSHSHRASLEIMNKEYTGDTMEVELHGDIKLRPER